MAAEVKCAVLCNGPSRTAYIDSEQYQWVVGCNIPWTLVHATTITDAAVIERWYEDPSLVQAPVILTDQAFSAAIALDKAFFEPRILKVVGTKYQYASSGHCAAIQALKQPGITHLDVYGADAAFSNNLQSYTRRFCDYAIPKKTDQQRWLQDWKRIRKHHPRVQICFVKP